MDEGRAAVCLCVHQRSLPRVFGAPLFLKVLWSLLIVVFITQPVPVNTRNAVMHS